MQPYDEIINELQTLRRRGTTPGIIVVDQESYYKLLQTIDPDGAPVVDPINRTVYGVKLAMLIIQSTAPERFIKVYGEVE